MTKDEVSATALKQALHESLGDLGFERFSYLALRLPDHQVSIRSPIFVSNYPRQWAELYLRKNYQFIDPVIELSQGRRRPLRWDLANWEQPLRPGQRRMLEEFREFGFGQGVTFPIHGPGGEFGLFTLASAGDVRCFENAVRKSGHNAYMIALHVHATIAEEQCEAKQNVTAFELTPKEKEVLLWAARGKTSWEAARIINRSEATVNYHMKQAIRKLNAANKCEAAVKATIHHLLDF